MHLSIVLEDEAQLAYTEAFSSVIDENDADQYNLAMQMLGLTFVPIEYCERLEEDLYMMTKKRSESVAKLHLRMMSIVRMLKNLPQSAMEIEEASQIRYFKRAMPPDWKRSYEISGQTFNTMADVW